MSANTDLEKILEPVCLSPSVVETTADVIYVLASDLSIVYCNLAWDRFASENGGPNLMREQILGTHLPEIIPQPLKKFYADAIAKVRETGEPWEWDFDCSSPELYRLFHMRILRLARASSLVETSLRIERPHEWQSSPEKAGFAEYSDEYGIVTMCCHCRRTKRLDSNVWDWIPRIVAEAPGRVSHGLCPTCLAYFYPSV